jgi:hypothetical protein
MASMKGFTSRSCVLNCSDTAADSIEHYCRCSKLKEYLHASCGHHCTHPLECIDDLFGVTKGLTTDLSLACARRLHVALHMLHFAKRCGHEHDFKFISSVEFGRTFR